MKDVAAWTVTIVPALVWFVGSGWLMTKTAKEMQKEDGTHWLGHMFFNTLWKVTTPRGVALARQTRRWAFGGAFVVVLTWILGTLLINAVLGPAPAP